ncbi:MAG: hypothetical protein IT583_03120 [Verrucomicrobia bacterium]|nr:hypothetical protein [Verrucomicrobiota bacterium]
MKKWMIVMLVGACTAGLAAAETNNVPWYKKLFTKSADESAPATAAPVVAVPEATKVQNAAEQSPKLAPEQMEKMKAHKAQMPQIKPEQMEKLKAHHAAMMKLGEAARNETDPVKKEALVAELRAKVTEGMDKMLAEYKKRVEQAEADLPKLKERLADAEKNKAARIEDQVKRILSGEMPMNRPEGKQPGGPKHEGKKSAPPTAKE